MVPEFVFIIPYRDRKEHKNFFDIYMNYLLEDYEKDSYEILFVHQTNNLQFNRGGMKNIGFLYLKEKYPKNYKNITLIFNDVDTLPYKKNLLNYKVKDNEIKHFYGFYFALGGILSIKAELFEKLNGFPNYWGWGFEDNVLKTRADENNIIINREQFYKINSPEILQFSDGVKRIIDRNILNKHFNKNYKEIDGLNHLNNLNYTYNHNTKMLDVSSFTSYYDHNNFNPYKYNVLNGSTIKKQTENHFFKMNLIK